MRKSKAVDYSGKRFNRLVAQKFAGRTKYGSSIWEFLCDCGNRITTPANQVIIGHTKSCGCWNDESRKSRATIHGLAKNPIYRIYHSAKARAKKLNIPFDLELSDIVVPELCPVLGIKLEFGKDKSTDRSPSLDRIVPELGYIKRNVHVISQKANTIKNNATSEELMKVANYFAKLMS